MSKDHEADPAILQSSVLARLDAIIRRHGGKPKVDVPPGRMTLPSVGKRTCAGQLEMFQSDNVGAAATDGPQ